MRWCWPPWPPPGNHTHLIRRLILEWQSELDLGTHIKGRTSRTLRIIQASPPLQTALVALITAAESYSAISEVVLVEVEGAPISQKSAAEAVLSAIAPAVKLRMVTATMKA